MQQVCVDRLVDMMLSEICVQDRWQEYYYYYYHHYYYYYYYNYYCYS